MNYNQTNIDDENIGFNSFFLQTSLIALLFSIGLYLQIKIVIVSIQEKDVTWKIDVCHSVVMIAYFSFRILFEVSTYLVPSLHQYTGKWLCHFALFVEVFCGLSLVCHSLVVATYKYIFIVHQDLIRVVGVYKASLISFWTSLCFPAVLAVSTMLRPSLPPIASITKCLGNGKVHWITENNRSESVMKTLFFCGFDDYANENTSGFSHFMDVINISGCFLTSALYLAIMANVMKIFFYQRIFAFMKRYDSIYMFEMFHCFRK